MNRIDNKLFLLFPFIIVVTCCTLVRYNFSIFVHTWPWIMLGCVLSLFIHTPFIHTKPFRWLVVYMMVVLANFLTGDQYFGDINIVANEFAVPFMACSLALYIMGNDRIKEAKTILFTGMAVVIITTICTEVINIAFPGIVRAASAWEGDETNSEMLMGYWQMGLSNYLLPHALPILIIPCFMGMFNSTEKGRKYIYFISLLFLLLLIYLGGSTTSIILAILAICFAVYSRGRLISARSALSFSFLILPFAIFPEILSFLLGSLANLFSFNETGSAYVLHLQDIDSYSRGNDDSNVALRFELYMKSINSFFSNIIVGTQNGEIGKHSVIFDRLGSLGLIGIVPFIGFFVSFFKECSQYIGEELKGNFLFCFLIGIFMILTKNMWNIEMILILMCCLPVLMYYNNNTLTQGR